MIKVKPNLMDELHDYGAFDVSACFNCGTCTATCPLVEEGNEFPRILIRLAQLGQEEKLVASKELWMCYYCGDCSASCPREADPGEFMMASRRYAVSRFDFSGISRSIYRNKWLTFVYMTLVAIIVGGGLYYADNNKIFGVDDHTILGGYFYETIHWGGIVSGSLLGLILLAGIWNMYTRVKSSEPLRQRDQIDRLLPLSVKIKLAFRTLVSTLYNEGILQKRFRKDDDETLPPERPTRWTIHMSIVWGFVGLAAATGLDYLVKDIVLNQAGQWVPIYYPIRLLGIISGIVLMYGTSYALYFRYTKPSQYYKESTFDDWLLLWLVWLAGFTGFVTTLFVYIPQSIMPTWAPWIVIVHVVAVAELFFILPFTKFAHVMYRPLALWMHEYEEEKINYLENLPPEEEPQQVVELTT